MLTIRTLWGCLLTMDILLVVWSYICNLLSICDTLLGSENNSFYVYQKYVSQPILKYKFSIPRNILVSCRVGLAIIPHNDTT